MLDSLVSLLESWGVNSAADQVEFLLNPGTLPFAVWETLYAPLAATILAYVIGLPLGILLVTGEEGGIHPLPKWLMGFLNLAINLLRSVPFLILMVMVFPLSRLILGTSVGTTATIIPLTVAAAPFVARLVECSLREMDRGVIEAAQSMAGAIGGGGLGAMALMRGHGRHQIVVMYAAVIILVILVQIIQSIGTALSVKSDRRIN